MSNVASPAVDRDFRLRFDADAGEGVHLFAQADRRICRDGMRAGGHSWSRLLCLGVVLGGLVSPSQSQQPHEASPSGSASPATGTATSRPAGPQEPLAHQAEEHMAERRNSERQKTLVADTDRLLALAQQLKADVDKSNKDMLSVDVVKRAEQIEKLARSVKEKMRGN